MARKVKITLIDDIDGSEAARNVEFSVEGKSYEIDLSQENIDRLHEALKEFVKAARPVRGRGARRPAAVASGPAPALVREWAKQNGYEVSPRGRISAEIMEAYIAAH